MRATCVRGFLVTPNILAFIFRKISSMGGCPLYISSTDKISLIRLTSLMRKMDIFIQKLEIMNRKNITNLHCLHIQELKICSKVDHNYLDINVWLIYLWQCLSYCSRLISIWEISICRSENWINCNSISKLNSYILFV